MGFTEMDLSRKCAKDAEIARFMKRVFPKEALMPMWMIKRVAMMKKYEFKAYYDDGLFVGILFTIDLKDTLFVFYLAVNDELHARGYGTKLLQLLFEQHPNQSVTLFIETMEDQTAENYAQRVKRLAFYERNGFVHTGIKVGFPTPFADILSTDQAYDMAKAKKLMKFLPAKLFSSN